MSLDTAENPVKVILDTNIIISAIGFGGKPREIFLRVLSKKVIAVSSSILLAELEEVVTKKFPRLQYEFHRVNRRIRRIFTIVQPRLPLNILKDEDDNRVLEAAIEGKCDYIITGDKELLALKSFKGISVLTAERFLKDYRWGRQKMN